MPMELFTKVHFITTQWLENAASISEKILKFSIIKDKLVKGFSMVLVLLNTEMESFLKVTFLRIRRMGHALWFMVIACSKDCLLWIN